MSYVALADLGAGSPPPVSPDTSDTQSMSVLGGVVLAGIVFGLGWLVYKEVQLRHKIAEKEGSAGVVKMTAAQTASHLATSAFDKAWE